MPEPLPVWTRDAVLALPDDGNRYELVAGALVVTPAPRWVHQEAVGRLYRLLAPFVEEHRLGSAVLSPADLQLRSGELYQPDLFVVPPPDDDLSSDRADRRVASLVIEVSSPTTAPAGRPGPAGALPGPVVCRTGCLGIEVRSMNRDGDHFHLSASQPG